MEKIRTEVLLYAQFRFLHQRKISSLYSDINPTRCNLTRFIYTWKLLYMFRVVSPPIIRSTHSCIYSICYLSNRYCYLPLSWESWNCSAVPTVPNLTHINSNFLNVATYHCENDCFYRHQPAIQEILFLDITSFLCFFFLFTMFTIQIMCYYNSLGLNTQYYRVFLDMLILNPFLTIPAILLAIFYFPAQFSNYRCCGFEIFKH